MNKRKIINIRILFVIAISFIFGIIFCFNLMKYCALKNNLFTVIFFVFIILLVIISFVFLIIFKRLQNIDFIKKYFNCYLIFIVFFLFSIIITYFALISSRNLVSTSSDVLITGRVSGYLSQNEEFTIFELREIMYKDKSNNVNKLNKNAKVYITNSYSAKYKLGDYITFNSKIKGIDIYKNNNISLYIKNTPYIFYLYNNSQIISHKSGRPNFSETIKTNCKTYLKSVMQLNIANISFSVLFGEKHDLGYETVNMFSFAGVSHILAVSGLHIGVLVVLLNKIFEKIKIKSKVSAISISAFLILYSFICNFTPSVVRASIMCIVLLLSRAFGRKYDFLCSISLSCVIILMLNPMSVFDIGFQLSFLCVLGIAFISPSLTKLFIKCKIPKALAMSLSISISTNIFIIPVVINTFDKINIVGIVANIFVIPLFSFAYNILFVSMFIVLVLPFLKFILIIPAFFIHMVRVVVSWFALFDFLNVRVFNISYFSYFLVMFIGLILRYFMIAKNNKAIFLCALSFLFSLYALFSVVPNNFNNSQINFSKFGSNYSIVTTAKEKTMIGCIQDDYIINKFNKRNKIYNYQYLLAYDFELKQIPNICNLQNIYKFKTIYIPTKFLAYKNEITKYVNNADFIDSIKILSNDFTFLEFNDKIIGVGVDNKFAFCSSTINKSNLKLFNNFINAGNVVIAKRINLDESYLKKYRGQIYSINSGTNQISDDGLILKI